MVDVCLLDRVTGLTIQLGQPSCSKLAVLQLQTSTEQYFGPDLTKPSDSARKISEKYPWLPGQFSILQSAQCIDYYHCIPSAAVLQQLQPPGHVV